MQIMGSDLMSGRWRDRQGGTDGYACRSGAMSIDNGLHLMSGGRRGYRDKKEGWRDEWTGGEGRRYLHTCVPCGVSTH